MTFKYKFNEEHLALVYNQVWESDPKYGGTLQVYNDLAPYEVEQIKEFLPSEPDSILELGAGLGRGSIYLGDFYRKSVTFLPTFVLADRDGFSEENTGAFNPKEDEYYNDFKLGRSFCRLNDLYNYRFVDTEKGNWANWGQFDLIFSFCSFGMHVEISRYLDRIKDRCHDDTVLIFGTRHASYGPQSFKDDFREVIYKPGEGKAPFPIENWLILKGPK